MVRKACCRIKDLRKSNNFLLAVRGIIIKKVSMAFKRLSASGVKVRPGINSRR